MAIHDQNGNPVTRSVRRELDGTWGANVWFGGLYGFATNLQRNYYRTRAQALAADISNDYNDGSGLVRSHAISKC